MNFRFIGLFFYFLIFTNCISSYYFNNIQPVNKNIPVHFEFQKNSKCALSSCKQLESVQIQSKFINYKKYPHSPNYYEDYIKRLNSRNITIQINEINGDRSYIDELESLYNNKLNQNKPYHKIIILGKGSNTIFPDDFNPDDFSPDNFGFDPSIFENQANNNNNKRRELFRAGKRNGPKKSENFEVITKSPISFKDIGGYDNIKSELMQCVDILTKYEKYEKYNVRVPKGLILEGPPGNGKTLLAKGFASEANSSFIPVSGSQFQDKYVGVGSSRVRELFNLAKDNIPCIIFIDEIDALGRKRSGDGENSGSERDNTLNELLINLDGFNTQAGIFLIGATNRIDLLDSALLRPGRIDKQIYIGRPDSKTREAVINIHIKGKFYDNDINIENLVEMTSGLSCAEIENVLNEAMLYAIRNNKELFNLQDVEYVINRMLVGWQPNEHQFTSLMIHNIAIHEMGHAIVGLLSKHHSKLTKVVLNLSSPKSPGYTMFETSTSTLYTRDALFEHLMILLSGRIAEEIFYGVSVTTGASHDFEEALKLAQKMVVHYGMGKRIIYPTNSEKYKQIIDEEVSKLLEEAYHFAHFIISNSKDLIEESANILTKDKILKYDDLYNLITTKYPLILNLKV
jgi:ATP-dependent metalloprotease FtsH